MSVNWTPEEIAMIEPAMKKYDAASGHCAALARIVYRTALPNDETTRGIQVRDQYDAPWLVRKNGQPKLWASHTLVETQMHNVDAMTTADGWPSDNYLEKYFEEHKYLSIETVDVFSIDTWIEDQGKES